MSDRIICQGCGQRITLPEGYRRNKIQCPECGVITSAEVAGRKPPGPGGSRADDAPFEVTGGPSQPSVVAARHIPAPEPDIASLPDPAPPPPKVRPQREPKAPEEKQPEPSAEPAVWTCSHCGEWQPHRPRGRKPCCPVCKTPLPVPAKTRTKGVTTQPLAARQPRVAVPQTDWSDDPEDSKPYRVDALEMPGCPSCGKSMEPQAIVCLHCGHDLRQGKKTRTVYDPIVRRWDAGLPRHLRWFCFATWQCFVIPPMIWGASHEGHAPYVIGGWLWLSLMVAFLTGTYDRIDLERNARGKVRLVKTWYFCFVPRPSLTVDLVQYEGIQTGQVHELDFSDYFVLMALLGFGLLPGIIWYLVIMQRDTWYVALTQDHGHPELWLYRGWSESRTREIAATLRTAVLPEYEWY
jgi:hypothetical protein